MEKIPMSTDQKTYYIKTTILPKLIYRFNAAAAAQSDTTEATYRKQQQNI